MNVLWSNLTLFVKGQSDEVFRKGIVTLFGKPADQDGERVPQRIILFELDGFLGSERDGQTVFTECKITLAYGEENSNEKREQYRLNTQVWTKSYTHTLKEEEVWLVVAVF